jgi:hypothetical protein
VANIIDTVMWPPKSVTATDSEIALVAKRTAFDNVFGIKGLIASCLPQTRFFYSDDVRATIYGCRVARFRRQSTQVTGP